MGNQGKEDTNPEQGWSDGNMGRHETYRKIVSLGKKRKETDNGKIIRKQI